MPGDHSRILRDVYDGGIDLDAHAEFLIGRVLATGTLAQVDWLRRHYGDERIAALLLAPGGARQLPARDLTFWALILGIQPDWADRLIDTKLASPWGR